MHRPIALALLLLAACAHASTRNRAPDAAEREVIDAVDDMFAAMKEHDPERLRARVMKGASIIRVRQAPDGRIEHGIVSDEAFIAGTAGDPSVQVDERFTTPPEVRIDGPIASLWGPYEVFVGGERLHCGVDIVQLARLDGRWQVTAITYTARACP